MLVGALPDRSNRGTSRIVARNFGCTGVETRLNSCSYTSISLSSGASYQTYTAAGVICQGHTSALTECSLGDVRLVNGSRETEGRVEVCVSGYWAIACDDWSSYYSWDISKTQLICKQLGLPAEC